MTKSTTRKKPDLPARVRKAIRKMLDYSLTEEACNIQEDYAENGDSSVNGHIFLEMQIVGDWLDGKFINAGWTRKEIEQRLQGVDDENERHTKERLAELIKESGLGCEITSNECQKCRTQQNVESSY